VDGLADVTTVERDGERPQGHSRSPSAVAPDNPSFKSSTPATGTGTFLVEAIDVIHRTLIEK